MARIIIEEVAHESHDLYFSAFIVASGIPIQALSREGQRCTFEFAPVPPERWGRLRASWLDGTATVMARRYADCIRDLKGMVHGRL